MKLRRKEIFTDNALNIFLTTNIFQSNTIAAIFVYNGEPIYKYIGYYDKGIDYGSILISENITPLSKINIFITDLYLQIDLKKLFQFSNHQALPSVYHVKIDSCDNINLSYPSPDILNPLEFDFTVTPKLQSELMMHMITVEKMIYMRDDDLDVSN